MNLRDLVDLVAWGSTAIYAAIVVLRVGRAFRRRRRRRLRGRGPISPAQM